MGEEEEEGEWKEEERKLAAQKLYYRHQLATSTPRLVLELALTPNTVVSSLSSRHSRNLRARCFLAPKTYMLRHLSSESVVGIAAIMICIKPLDPNPSHAETS
jgi:hypothetical protein